jgi:hypothetical protein
MKIDIRDIFEQIGNAFYAVATDLRVKPIEQGELKSIIAKDWLPRNQSGDGMISNEAHCIMMAMDANEGERLTSNDAFKEFSKFYQLHRDFFTTELMKRILDTANEIASTFKKGNSSDNSYLKNLKELFQF